MGKPEIGPTVGKVTYIHGATPKRQQGYAGLPPEFHPITGRPTLGDRMRDADLHRNQHGELEARLQRTTLMQLEAAEQHSDVSRPMPAAPSVRVSPDIYFDGERVTEVYVDRFYAGPDPNQSLLYTFSEAEDHESWASPQKPSRRAHRPIDWLLIGQLICIMAMLMLVGAGAYSLISWRLSSDFPKPSISSPK